jgi:hypothetical protein
MDIVHSFPNVSYDTIQNRCIQAENRTKQKLELKQ